VKVNELDKAPVYPLRKETSIVVIVGVLRVAIVVLLEDYFIAMISLLVESSKYYNHWKSF
jgi:hypothetical protein